MINEIKLMGRISNEPKLQETAKGNQYVKIDIAVDTKGNTNFIPVTLWNKSAEYVANNLEKGALIMLQGKIKCNVFTNASGYNQKQLEVVADTITCLETKAVREARKQDVVESEENNEEENTRKYVRNENIDYEAIENIKPQEEDEEETSSMKM
ncbi:single-stranded DNA-binding protein [Mycoplasma sp. VS292A]|uniref:single-stranded DNA-binding protein n=1 Tax=Mycoplasma sp. VS292A TaxID=3401680 RepID=UPI003AAECA02